MAYTGIRFHIGRKQPYTLWIRGQVEGFYKVKFKAEQKLVNELKRILA